jgi:hypothetical protein
VVCERGIASVLAHYSSSDTGYNKTDLLQCPAEEPILFITPTPTIFVDNLLIRIFGGGRNLPAKLNIQILKRHRTNMSLLQRDEDRNIGAHGAAIADSIQVGLHVHKAEKIAQANPLIASIRVYEIM